MNHLAHPLAQLGWSRALCLALGLITGCPDDAATPAMAAAPGGQGAEPRATAEPPDCADEARDTVELWQWSLGGALDQSQRERSYDGWAVVERADAAEVVLTIAAEALATQAQDDVAQEARVTVATYITGVEPGMRIWVHAKTDRNFSGLPRPKHGDELTLRDREGGTLLLGVSVLPDLHGDALRFADPQLVCSHTETGCVEGTTSLYSLEAQADSPVRIGPFEQREIELRGRAYDLTVRNSVQQLTTKINKCPDGYREDRLWVESSLRLRDPAQIVAGLAVVLGR